MRNIRTDWLQHLVLFSIVTALLISCEKHPELPDGTSSKIVFSSIDTVTVSYRFVIITCGIENTGGNNISQHGFCWNTSSEPDLLSNKIELGILENPGVFSDSLTSLLPNTTYYVRAYTKSNNLIVYSNEQSFTTLDVHGTLTDSRDNKTYNTIRIGNLWWMVENLNFYTSSDSWCYNDSVTYAETYGRLYTWGTANNVCPAGWHLPTDAEWKELEMYLGMTQAQADGTGFRGADQGSKLKEGGASEFSALLGGYRNSIGSFYSINSGTGFWSSSESGSLNVWVRILGVGNEQVGRFGFNKSYGFYVRCVKD